MSTKGISGKIKKKGLMTMRLKYLLIGFAAGTLLATAGTSIAAPVLEKVTATIRADFGLEIDGESVQLKNAPLAYNGASYLPVRELSELLGKDVDFDNDTILLTTKEEETMSEQNLENWVSIDQLKLDGHDVRVGIGLLPGETAKSNKRMATVSYYVGTTTTEVANFTVDSVLLDTKEFVNDDGVKLLFHDGEFYLESKFIESFVQ